MSRKNKHKQQHTQIDEKNLGQVTGGIAPGGGCYSDHQGNKFHKPYPQKQKRTSDGQKPSFHK